MDVVVQLLHQVTIAVGQFLLLFERYHCPVDVVDALQRILNHALLLVGSQFLVDFGHSVGCRDGTAHIDGLAKHDRSGEHVPRVSLEGIVDLLANLIA